jgi:hypothetical protein
MGKNIKYDWDDIVIIPAVISEINSRSEINILEHGKLPLMVAPMDRVISRMNANVFEDNNIQLSFPRNTFCYDLYPDAFYSFGIDELESVIFDGSILPKRVLIDVANGNMRRVIELGKTIKELYDVILMVGNIANPETYRVYCESGFDYARCSVGSGSACTTACNTAIHYPVASLIQECNHIRDERESNNQFACKIVADGGFKKYSDVIKALALGADVVMLGGIFNKALESDSYIYYKNGLDYIPANADFVEHAMENGIDLYKEYRGMSTKAVQKDWGRTTLKTSEGIVKFNKVEYTLGGWVENFSDYLKTALSYSNKENISDFRGNVEIAHITLNALRRFDK